MTHIAAKIILLRLECAVEFESTPCQFIFVNLYFSISVKYSTNCQMHCYPNLSRDFSFLLKTKKKKTTEIRFWIASSFLFAVENKHVLDYTWHWIRNCVDYTHESYDTKSGCLRHDWSCALLQTATSNLTFFSWSKVKAHGCKTFWCDFSTDKYIKLTYYATTYGWDFYLRLCALTFQVVGPRWYFVKKICSFL